MMTQFSIQCATLGVHRKVTKRSLRSIEMVHCCLSTWDRGRQVLLKNSLQEAGGLARSYGHLRVTFPFTWSHPGSGDGLWVTSQSHK